MAGTAPAPAPEKRERETVALDVAHLGIGSEDQWDALLDQFCPEVSL